MDDTINNLNIFKHKQNQFDNEIKEKIKLDKEKHLNEMKRVEYNDSEYFDKNLEYRVNEYNKLLNENNTYQCVKQKIPPQDSYCSNNIEQILLTDMSEKINDSDPSKIYKSNLNEESRMRYLKKDITNLTTSTHSDLILENIEKYNIKDSVNMGNKLND